MRHWLRVALLVYMLGVLLYRDALMDDTFIHLQYARNLRENGEIAFNAGEPSFGMTSPLWVMMLAAAGHTDTVARLASVAFGARSVWVFALLAWRVLGGGAFAAAASVAWAGNVWLVRHAPNGMESTCALFLVLLAVELRARRGRSAAREVAEGLVLAAAFLARPECALLVAVHVIADLRSAARRGRLRHWLPAFAVASGAWLAFAYSRTGSLWADTAAVKAAGPALARSLAVVWRQVRIVGAAHAVEIVGCVAALFLSLRLEGWKALGAGGRHPLVTPLGFTALWLLLYAVADVQVQPRYLLPVLPFVTLAGFAAWKRTAGGGWRLAVALTGACLALSALVSGLRVLPMTRDFSRALRPALLDLVKEVESRSAPPVYVATPDIGVVGYYGQVRVVDLGGLTNRGIQELRRRVGYDEMLQSGAFLELGPVDYVIDRSLEPRRFDGHLSLNVRWRALRTTTLPNLGLGRAGPYYYTLYAVETNDRATRAH
jgi:hypothetical protein